MQQLNEVIRSVDELRALCSAYWIKTTT